MALHSLQLLKSTPCVRVLLVDFKQNPHLVLCAVYWHHPSAAILSGALSRLVCSGHQDGREAKKWAAGNWPLVVCCRLYSQSESLLYCWWFLVPAPKNSSRFPQQHLWKAALPTSQQKRKCSVHRTCRSPFCFQCNIVRLHLRLWIQMSMKRLWPANSSQLLQCQFCHRSWKSWLMCTCDVPVITTAMYNKQISFQSAYFWL